MLLLPSAPILSAPVDSLDGAYTIAWSDDDETVTQYVLQERINGGIWSTLLDSDVSTYSVSGRADGQYGYQIKACNSAGCSPYSNPHSVEVWRTPASPGEIQGDATNNSDDYTLSWEASPLGTVHGYTLEERRNGGDWLEIHNTLETSKVLSDQEWGTYEYRVKACNSLSCSNWGDIKTVQVTITSTPENSPSPYDAMANLTALVASSLVDASDSVGSVAGQFRVDESGNAVDLHVTYFVTVLRL